MLACGKVVHVHTCCESTRREESGGGAGKAHVSCTAHNTVNIQYAYNTCTAYKNTTKTPKNHNKKNKNTIKTPVPQVWLKHSTNTPNEICFDSCIMWLHHTVRVFLPTTTTPRATGITRRDPTTTTAVALLCICFAGEVRCCAPIITIIIHLVCVGGRGGACMCVECNNK